MRKKRMVEVEWVDSTTWGGWKRENEYLKDAGPGRCSSVGYLLKSDKQAVTLVQNLDVSNGNVSDAVSIPRSVVRKITTLEHKT